MKDGVRNEIIKNMRSRITAENQEIQRLQEKIKDLTESMKQCSSLLGELQEGRDT